MAIKVYNTLTRKKEDFQPQDPPHVRIYVCGITPYAQSHIGHSRYAVLWDVVRRYLTYRGYDVAMAQNFTDVEDKLIDAARESGQDPMAIAESNIAVFLKDLRDLGVTPAEFQPRASQHIDDIIEMVTGLVDKGYAYVVEGDVYFEVDKFPEYGKLSGRDAESVRSGARVSVDERKRDPRDFALWKAAKPGEPAWPSPWGPGRPGWHIECSVMSLKYLGENFDFHGGGTDLIFPHHENEIAQSEAFLGGRKFANNWVHHEMLNIRSEKMSKSLGNIVTIRDVLDRFPGPAVRYFILSTHYRKMLEFSMDLVGDAAKGWQRLQKTASESAAYLWALGWRKPSGKAGNPDQAGLARAAVEARQRFEEAMDDDFNTAQAIGVLFDLENLIVAETTLMDFGSVEKQKLDELGKAVEMLFELGGLLGLIERPRFAPKALFARLGVEPTGNERPAVALRHAVTELVQKRLQAKQERAWDVADGIRKKLTEAGIKLEDTKSGYRWRPEVTE